MIADEGFATITLDMNNEDPDELVCWSESEEGGSPVASADGELQTTESIRANATNCNAVFSTAEDHQDAAC